ncbi:hypothetical protein [Pseudomonas sp. MONT-RG-20F-20-E-7-02]|uniref:hypothetical protein n=1 Tax=Pseudomonas sp. MONT-RG-20F-20-E-7-02 TaxID=2914979 RepID=UPI001F58325B|nr:hypothetical protein [Pseudomonas sp. MONT-RG-20F-20-E-7-02]
MAIDASIPLSTSGNGNLLQTLMGATQLRGIQQQQQANVAASQAYKENTRPDGTIDYGALTAALSQGPAAYNLPQIQAQINEARNSQLNYDKNKLELAQKRTDLLSGGFGSLLASGNITPQSVMQLATQGIKQGLFSPEEAVNFTSDMPTDPAALANWAKQKYVGFSTDADRLKTIMPQTQVINSGGQQQLMAIDPTTGQPRVTGVVNNTMAPGDANSLVQVYDPVSQSMRMVTKAQAAQAAQGGSPIGMGGAPQGDGSLGSGRLNPITQAPGIQAAPSLGSAEAAAVVGKGAAEQSLNLQSLANAAPQTIYQFQNMREALKDINTGPGTDWRNQASAFAQALSPTVAAAIGIDPQKIASAEEFKKYATQATQATLAGLGEGTDAKLASAASANPGTTLSKLGNEQLIDVLVSGQRAIVAKNQAWQNSGLPPEQFNKFSSQWNKDVDPRLFSLQDMPREKAIAMRNSLKPTEQKAFDASYNKAVAQGLIQRIGQ